MILAAKLLEIGKTFLRTSHANNAVIEPSRAEDSVKWLQKAFAIIEVCDSADTPGFMELKAWPPFRPHAIPTDRPS